MNFLVTGNYQNGSKTTNIYTISTAHNWILLIYVLGLYSGIYLIISSLHSETGNIWTHLIGLVILFFAMIFIFIRPIINPDNYPFYPQGIQEYLCFGAFFIGGCSCLTFSWLFHTLYCHSPAVNKLFAKYAKF